MLVGYARISTADQHLSVQIEALERFGVERVFTDQASGATLKRQGLNECLRFMEKGDVLLVQRLDRLARSLRQLLDIMDNLEKRGIGLRSLNESIDTTTAVGRMVIQIFGAVAEFERGLIAERTVAGLKSARARGVKIGRERKATKEKIERAKELLRGGMSIRQVSIAVGLAESTLYRDIPGGASGFLDDPVNDVDLPEVPTS